jgi:hypothetical protein
MSLADKQVRLRKPRHDACLDCVELRRPWGKVTSLTGELQPHFEYGLTRSILFVKRQEWLWTRGKDENVAIR